MAQRRLPRALIETLVVLAVLLGTTACAPSSSSPPTAGLIPAYGTVTTATAGPLTFVWISADKDTWIDSDLPTRDSGGSNILKVGNESAGQPTGHIQVIYAHFFTPKLPAAAVVVGAFFEFYHGGSMEDGTSDAISLTLSPNHETWSPHTMTWATSAVAKNGPTGSGPPLHLRSIAWSPSDNLAPGYLSTILDPANDGWNVFPSSVAAPGAFYKEFTADNEPARTKDDLDHAPRLLLVMNLQHSSPSDIIWPPDLPPDTDLNTIGSPVLMYKVASGLTGFPPEWDVHPF